MIQLRVKCPACGRTLMKSSPKIDGKPSALLNISYGGRSGRLYLSAVYGSYQILCDINVPSGKVARFFCPNCRSLLRSSRKCEQCKAPMAAFKLRDGGKIQICSRRGCKKHLLEFQDPESELEAFYKSYTSSFH